MRSFIIDMIEYYIQNMHSSTLVNFLNYCVWYPPLFHLIGYVRHPFFILKFELGILHFEKAQLRKLERKTYIITFNQGPS